MKPIPEFPEYSITKDGKVWSNPKKTSRGVGLHHCGKWLSPRLRSGYLGVTFSRNGRLYTRTIHSLVLTVYGKPRPIGLVCRHLDGNKLNNYISNLRWGTISENAQDEIRHGGRYGAKNGHAKLKKEDIKVILYLRNIAKFPLSVIAWHFRVTRSNIGHICRGETWKCLSMI